MGLWTAGGQGRRGAVLHCPCAACAANLQRERCDRNKLYEMAAVVASHGLGVRRRKRTRPAGSSAAMGLLWRRAAVLVRPSPPSPHFARRTPPTLSLRSPPVASLSHLFDKVALCYRLSAATRCDSRSAQRSQAQLAALLEAPREI